MKRLTTIGMLSLSAAAAYAQGTLVFNNNVPGTVVTHIYSPNPANPGVQQTGLGGNDTPSGSATFGGQLLGGATGAAGSPINYTFGNNFTAQIYALGLNGNTGNGVQPFSSLQPVSQYVTTLSTSPSTAGFIVAVSPNNDPGIPNNQAVADANNGTVDNHASVSLAVWYNAGGTINSYAAAIAAGVPAGASPVYNIVNLGEPSSIETAANGTATPATNPAFLGSSTSTTKLQSFSLTQTVPEPSTIALGLMGACAFLARRRKK